MSFSLGIVLMHINPAVKQNAEMSESVDVWTPADN